ncbi:MAG: hypothetical protein RIC56_15585 [Pseudomonadales bacterium]
MNWEAVGAAGELLGSLLVLATLIYLSIQTRSINKQAKAEARYAFVESVGAINMSVAQNSRNASVWRRGLEAIDELTEDERMQFFMFIGQYANLWSVMHQLHLDRVLPETQWVIVRNDIRSIMGSTGGRYFWSHGGASAFDEEFADFINREITDYAPSYDMARLAEDKTTE